MGSGLSHDVQQLISKRDRAVERIDQKLIEELEKLKVKYTKAGDLESANKTVELIEKYSAKPTDIIPNIETELVGKWAGRSSAGWRGEYHFLPNGKFYDSSGKWSIVAGGTKLVCRWKGGKADTFDLPPIDGVMSGVSPAGHIITATKLRK
ncbi:MAG: hypothetical protein Q7Q71_07040 [Verrucomicrobiota bacterium JB023]|nr:hypothetical protein [Verrucomicrobiota bacterium JB023]